MNIMAPVNSYQSALLQIKAGADEIYVGLHDDFMDNLTFSGRGKVSNNGIKINPDLEELQKIIKLAHENNIKVNYTANTQYMSDSKDNYFQKKYYEYVKAGIDLGVDQIIVGDIGNILYLRKKKISLPIVGSTFLSTFNVESAKFWKSLGVKRVVLPHQVTISEIAEIKKNVNIELEIFVGVGCSNIDGSCQFLHNAGEDIQFGLPCKSLYCVKRDNEDLGKHNFIDATLDCALCSLYKLYDIGVDAIKIIGRDQNPIFTSAITRIHRKCIDHIEKYNTLDKVDIEEYIKNIPWWKKQFCDNNRCKYKNNRIISSYV